MSSQVCILGLTLQWLAYELEIGVSLAWIVVWRLKLGIDGLSIDEVLLVSPIHATD